MKLTKYLCHVLTMKYTSMELMMKPIRWLIFIKAVLQVVKRLKKDCGKREEIKKECDKKEEIKKDDDN